MSAFRATLVLLLIGAVASVLAYILTTRRGWQLKNRYFATALIIGTVFLFVIPPFMVPDEKYHYPCAYHVSNVILGIEDPEDTNYLYMRKEDTYFNKGNENTYFNEGKHLSADTYSHMFRRFSAKRDERLVLHKLKTQRTCRNIYYLIPGCGIALARLLHLPFGFVLLFGQFFNLLFFLLLTRTAIGWMPYGGKSLFATAFLPMTLQQISSFSYDAPLFGCFFAVFAAGLALAERKKLLLKGKEVRAESGGKAALKRIFLIVLLLLMVILLLGIKGGIYAVVLLVPLMAAFRKDVFCGVHKKAVRMFLLLAAAAAAAAVCWFVLTGRAENWLNIWPVTPAFPSVARSPRYLLTHPSETVMLYKNTIRGDSILLLQQMVGHILCQLDVYGSQWASVPLIVLLLLTAIPVRGEERPRACVRIGALLAGVLVVFLSSTAMLLYWTPYCLDIIQGIQGRYFLPAIPLMLIGAGYWKKPKRLQMRERTADGILISVLIFSAALTFSALYNTCGL